VTSVVLAGIADVLLRLIPSVTGLTCQANKKGFPVVNALPTKSGIAPIAVNRGDNRKNNLIVWISRSLIAAIIKDNKIIMMAIAMNAPYSGLTQIRRPDAMKPAGKNQISTN
jgi:hypothetical protein